MQRASEVYEAEVMPREPLRLAARMGLWLHDAGLAAEDRGAEPVVADIVVIDLRNGAERVEISVTGAQVLATLAQVQSDLDDLSVESFDERWGVL